MRAGSDGRTHAVFCLPLSDPRLLEAFNNLLSLTASLGFAVDDSRMIALLRPVCSAFDLFAQ